MKKILSVLVTLAMLVGILSSFSYVSGADTVAESEPSMYSGGSGTEDDPYLIGSEKDITTLSNNILTDPSLYGAKKHYKLINDIKISKGISPVYELSLGGKNCSVESEFDVSYIRYLLEEYTEEEFEAWYSEIVSQMGYLYKKTGTRHAEGMYYVVDTTPMYSRVYFDVYVRNYYGEKNPGYNNELYRTFYRNAAFTGVFDGNGHSIELAYQSTGTNYLFGYLKNGAVVKNLELLGECASLAYSVDKTSLISDCIINTDKTFAEIYQYYDATDYDTYIITGGAIAINNGTVQNCTNYAKGISGLIGYNSGTAVNCVNFGEIVPTGEGLGYTDKIGGFSGKSITHYLSQRDDCSYFVSYPSTEGITNGKCCIDYATHTPANENDGYFTANECEAASGDPEIYKSEGFDFETVWIMIDGTPTLRSTLEVGTGDLNLDSVVNSIDTNLIKRYMAGSSVNIEYTHPLAADMDNNGKVDAIDSSLIKRQLAG